MSIKKTFTTEAGPYDGVISRQGEPILLNGKGAPSGFNPMFAPAVYASQHEVMHDALSLSFYEYDPETGLWTTKTRESMRRKLNDLLIEIGDELEHRDLVAKERSDSKLAGTLNNLAALTDGRFDDRPHGYIHCRNGMLDVRTTELLPFDPKYKSRNATPFDWDPTAACPRFLDELLRSALAEEDITVLQFYVGMCLMGRNLAQKILLVTGTPGGGKSALCIVIEGLIGRANYTQLRTEQLAGRFEIARYVGKTLLSGKDVPGDFLMTKGAQVLKALTGGDALTTEYKSKMGCDTIDGEFNIVITSNARLRVYLDGDDGAWARRLLVVKYERPKPEKAIPDFARKLLAEEGPGILRWAVEGAQRLLELDYVFPDIEAQRARVESLLNESNALRTFVGSEIVVSTGDSLTTVEIVEAFFAYCQSKSWVAGSVGAVERALPDVMMEVHRAAKSGSIARGGGAVKGFRGVKLVLQGRSGTFGTAFPNPYVSENGKYSDKEFQTSVPSVPPPDRDTRPAAQQTNVRRLLPPAPAFSGEAAVL
jgi:putative DNA primase/helicase